MIDPSLLIHERTLLGAIDSYLGGLVHVRPHLATGYRASLELLADQWLAAGGTNELTWAFVHNQSNDADSDKHTKDMIALEDFARWAQREHLLLAD